MTDKSPRILNIGCGKSTYGTDFVDLYPSRKEVKKLNIDTQRLPYKSNTFDLVICDSALQNFTSPANFFKESYRVLKKDGKLIVLAANAGFWGTFGNAFYGGYEKTGKRGKIDSSMLLFTPIGLENMFRRFGFKGVRWTYRRRGLTSKVEEATANRILIRLLSSLNKRWHPHIYCEGTK